MRFFKQKKILSQLGENIKLARKRRKMNMVEVCDQAGISRTTLWNIEKGSQSVAIGSYLKVLTVFDLQEDLLKIASEDIEGRKLQDAELK